MSARIASIGNPVLYEARGRTGTQGSFRGNFSSQIVFDAHFRFIVAKSCAKRRGRRNPRVDFQQQIFTMVEAELKIRGALRLEASGKIFDSRFQLGDPAHHSLGRTAVAAQYALENNLLHQASIS